MTPNDNSVILIDQCFVQPSSQKLPPAADGNINRDPQSYNMKRVRKLGTFSPRKDVSVKLFPSLRGTAEEEAEIVRGDGGQQRNKAF